MAGAEGLGGGRQSDQSRNAEGMYQKMTKITQEPVGCFQVFLRESVWRVQLCFQFRVFQLSVVEINPEKNS